MPALICTTAVRGGIFRVLGKLCEVYPECMVSMSDRLVDMYVKTLKAEMVSKQQKKKPDMPLIGGCLRVLTSYLTQFSQSVAEGEIFFTVYIVGIKVQGFCVIS